MINHVSPSIGPDGFVYRDNAAYAAIRRSADLVIASTILAFTAPVIAAAALGIWLEDRGTPLFVQRRVGRYGRIFDIYKLRTMKANVCGDALSPTQKTDSRVTRLGRFLRKASIDELPQLINVIKGNMTLVGPRPEQPFLVAKYERWQRLRLLVKPGITCFWQIRCRSSIPLHEPAATVHDLEYISSASPRTDGLILLGTLRAVLSSKGAY